MVKSLLLGGILGGITLFAWLGFSWAVLPFHRAALRELPLAQPASADADAVPAGVELLGQAGVGHGIYYSGMPHEGSRKPEIPFMVYLPPGYPSQASVMITGLLLTIFAATLVTLILLTAGVASYKARVGLSIAIGAVVALAGPMTFANFFFVPKNFLIPEILDQLIGWALAGLVIAIFTKPLAPASELAS